jgi:hypothetical protein
MVTGGGGMTGGGSNRRLFRTLSPRPRFQGDKEERPKKRYASKRDSLDGCPFFVFPDAFF